MNKNWNGILKIFEIQHISSTGEIISSQKNLYNTLHSYGEEFILSKMCNKVTLYGYFWMGLDNRSNITIPQTISDLVGEPFGSGYSKKSINAAPKQNEIGFTVEASKGQWIARGPLITWTAAIANWSSVSNLFLTAPKAGMPNGELMSTVVMAKSVALRQGESLTLRAGVGLRDCPD